MAKTDINRISLSSGNIEKFLTAFGKLNPGEFFYQYEETTINLGGKEVHIPANSLITKDNKAEGGYHILSAEKFLFERGNFKKLVEDIVGEGLDKIPVGSAYVCDSADITSSSTLPSALQLKTIPTTEEATAFVPDLSSSLFANINVFRKDATNNTFDYRIFNGDLIVVVDAPSGKKLLYVRNTNIFASNVLYKSGSLEEYLNNPIRFGTILATKISADLAENLNITIHSVDDLLTLISQKYLTVEGVTEESASANKELLENLVVVTNRPITINGQNLEAGSMFHVSKDTSDNFEIKLLPFGTNTQAVKYVINTLKLTEFLKNVKKDEDDRDDNYYDEAAHAELAKLTSTEKDATLTNALDFLFGHKADLDKNGKVPLSELPDTITGGMEFKGALKFDGLTEVTTFSELVDSYENPVFNYIFKQINVVDTLVTEIAKTEFEDLKEAAEVYAQATNATDTTVQAFLSAIKASENADAKLSEVYTTIESLPESIVLPFCGKHTNAIKGSPVFSSIEKTPEVGDIYQYFGPTITAVCEEKAGEQHSVVLRYGCKLIYSGVADNGTKEGAASKVDNFWEVLYDYAGSSSALTNIDGIHYDSLETIEFLKRYINGNAINILSAVKVNESTTLFKLDNKLAYINEETVKQDYLPKFGPDFSLKESKVKVVENVKHNDTEFTPVGDVVVKKIGTEGNEAELVQKLVKIIDAEDDSIVINETLKIINRSGTRIEADKVTPAEVTTDDTYVEKEGAASEIVNEKKSDITEVIFSWGKGENVFNLKLPRYLQVKEDEYVSSIVTANTICTQSYAQFLIEEKLKGSLKGEKDVVVTYTGKNELHESGVKITAKDEKATVGFTSEDEIMAARRTDVGETVQTGDEAVFIENNKKEARFGFKSGDAENILPENSGILLNSTSVIDGGLWI